MPIDTRRARGLIAPAITAIAYVAAAGSAVAMTRFGGGAAFLWVANAVLLAFLVTHRPDRWLLAVVLC